MENKEEKDNNLNIENKELDISLEERIESVLSDLRPYLVADGGDIEFVKYTDGICYVKFTGHCATCPMKMMTLNTGIKEALIASIPEIVDVELI